MRVLVACEYSGIIRDAFKTKGHDAWSCDIIPTESPGNHIQGDCLDILNDDWDLMICHPPCTHLAVAGGRWFYKKKKRQQKALDFVLALFNAPIPMICLENPISIISSIIGKPTQIVQPYHFGHTENKPTCLWLKNLPKLKKTKVVKPEFFVCKDGRRKSKFSSEAFFKCAREGKMDQLGKIRSKTFQGMADAMADQWGILDKDFRLGFDVQLPKVIRNPYLLSKRKS